MQAQAQVPYTQAQARGHAKTRAGGCRHPAATQEVLLCLVGIAVVLKMQGQLVWQVVQRHLCLLLLHCSPVLAKGALQVEGHWNLRCQRRLWSRVGQGQLHIVLRLQTGALELWRQPSLLLLL